MKKIIKIQATFVAILFFVAFSEGLYLYKNSNIVAKYYLTQVEKSLAQNDLDQALNSLDKAAIFYIKKNRKISENEIPLSENIDPTELDQETQNKMLLLIKNELPEVLQQNNKNALSDIYHNLGLILYESNYLNQARVFLKNAVSIEPFSSFLHIDYANSFFNHDLYEQGLAALEFCQLFDSPKVHCQEYLEKNVKANQFLKVGNFSNKTY